MCKKSFFLKIGVSTLLSGVLSISSSAFADTSASLQPFGQVGLSQKEQSFGQLLDQDLSFYILRVGGGIAFNKSFVAVYGDWDIGRADVSEEEETGNAGRTEYDLSLGYRVTPSFTLLGGYKYGETEINFIPRDLEDDPSLQPFQDTYKETGPYLGAAFHHQFAQAGTLSLSLAYAFLDGENIIGAKPDDEEDDETGFDDLSGKFDTDADGISAGLSWHIPVGKQLSYLTTLKYQRYDQKFTLTNGSHIEVEEEFTELGMALIYQF